MLKAGGKIEENIIEKELELKQLERARKELANKEWARPFIKECFKLITNNEMTDELFEEYHTTFKEAKGGYNLKSFIEAKFPVIK